MRSPKRLAEETYARLFGRPAFRRLNSFLFKLGARGLGLLNGEPSLTGEMGALRTCLADLDAPVVFDVGANKGDWSRAVLQQRPAASLHVFEPSPALAEILRRALPGAAVNLAAVGATPGTATLHSYAEDPTSEHASLHRAVMSDLHQAKEIVSWDVPVVTLDGYCADHGVHRIDLLKIDVEGGEYDVLLGAKGLLEGKRVDRVQFEFNEMNTISRRFFADFADLLADFELYRILPVGLLPLKGAAPWKREQFIFQNILALRPPS